MQTYFQKQLYTHLQANHDYFSSDELAYKGFEKDTWKGKSVNHSDDNKKIQTEIEQFIKNNDQSDTQLLDRVCILCRVDDGIKKKLLSKYGNNQESCAETLYQIITKRNNKVDSASRCSDIESDISTDIKTENKTSSYYFLGQLNNWVSESTKNELRQQAADKIMAAYVNKNNKLDLRFLDLTTLPSAIKYLPYVTDIDISFNKLTMFPEFFYNTNNHFLKINISLNSAKFILTPGIKKLILFGGCEILSDIYLKVKINEFMNFHAPSFTQHAIQCENNNDVFMNDGLSVVKTKTLDIEVEKLLKEASMESETDKTQDGFIQSLNEFRATDKTKGISNLRSFMVEDGQINILGCSLWNKLAKKDHPFIPESLTFIYNNINSLLLLSPRNDVLSLPFLKQCAGNDEYSPTQVKSIPVMDFSFPRLEQFNIVLQEINKVRYSICCKSKAVLISCEIGEGRTGTFLAMIQLVDKFKLLNPSKRKELTELLRLYTPEQYNGNFQHYNKDIKINKLVANTVNKIRKEENNEIGKGISVETDSQFLALELIHLMLIFNERIQDDPSITDEQILKYVYDHGFTRTFILEFADVYYTKPNDDAFTKTDMLKYSEKYLLERIRDIHTVI